MRLVIGLLDLIKFENIRNGNEYLQEVVKDGYGEFIIETDDSSEIERILNKNRIKYKIRRW